MSEQKERMSSFFQDLLQINGVGDFLSTHSEKRMFLQPPEFDGMSAGVFE